MKKIKEFLMQKVNYKHIIVIGIILYFFGVIVYLLNKNQYYVLLSVVGVLFIIVSPLIHFAKLYKKDIVNTMIGSICIIIVLISLAILSNQMYKITNISKDIWLNLLGTLLASITGAGIAGGISYFLVLKQIQYNNEALKIQIDENKRLTQYTLEEAKKETSRQNRNAALNYIYLLNTEMELHRESYVIYIYYKTYKRLILKFGDDDTLKLLNIKMWNNIKVECAKYFSNKLMQELTGYYYGIEIFKEIKLNGKQKKEIIKSQIASLYKCIEIIESEFNIELRKQEVYYIENKKVRTDKTNGELIVE